MKKLEAIKKWLEDSGDDILYIHREYCMLGNYDDEVFYNDEEFFETNFNCVMDVVRAIHYGDYEYMQEYVTFDSYGYLTTSDYISDLIDIDTLAEFIFENQEKFNIEV